VCEAGRRWLAAASIRLRLDISTPGGRSVNFDLSMLFVVSVVALASAALGARGASTTLAGSTALVSCTDLSLSAGDRPLDWPACAPTDTRTIAATKANFRISRLPSLGPMRRLDRFGPFLCERHHAKIASGPCGSSVFIAC